MSNGGSVSVSVKARGPSSEDAFIFFSLDRQSLFKSHGHRPWFTLEINFRCLWIQFMKELLINCNSLIIYSFSYVEYLSIHKRFPSQAPHIHMQIR